MTTCKECHINHVHQLIVRVIMRWCETRAPISWHLPYAWVKPRKTSARRLSDEGCNQSSSRMGSLASKWFVGSHSTSEREKEGKKERSGRFSRSTLPNSYTFPFFISFFFFTFLLSPSLLDILQKFVFMTDRLILLRFFYLQRYWMQTKQIRSFQ